MKIREDSQAVSRCEVEKSGRACWGKQHALRVQQVVKMVHLSKVEKKGVGIVEGPIGHSTYLIVAIFLNLTLQRNFYFTLQDSLKRCE